MKIVHLCLGNFFIDNYSYQENMLTKHHALMGHDVTVIASLQTFGPNGEITFLPTESVYHHKGCKIIRLDYKSFPFKRFNKFFRIYHNFYKVLEQEAPEIIFSHNVAYGDTFAVARYIKSHPGTRLYCDNHGDYYNSCRNFLSKNVKHRIMWSIFAAQLNKYAIKFYGVTPARCEYLHDIFFLPKDKIEYLPLGVDDESIPKDREKIKNEIIRELDIPQDAMIVITGGKIDESKNTHYLLEAIKQMPGVNLHLILFGNVAPQMKTVIESYFNDPRIHFVGWSSAEDVMNYMVASDFCCFPGTHSTLWEQSIGLGIPGIFKRWYNGMNQVDINGNCILIKGDDIVELKNAISKLMDKDIYLEMKRRSIDASKDFLYSEIAKRSIEQ